MRDFKIIPNDEAFSLVMEGNYVLAVELDDKVVYEVNHMTMNEFSDFYKSHHVIFVVKETK